MGHWLYIGLLTLSSTTYAAAIDTTLWSSIPPSTLTQWEEADNRRIFPNDATSLLLSEFVATENSNFSGRLSANEDDDILGVVFGWQDADNHYRLGWEGGGLDDEESGASGLFLVKEVAGISEVLFESEQFWQANTVYPFSLYRSGDNIGFSLDDQVQRFIDSTFSSGQIGLYVDSQAATFSSLSHAPVPIPPAVFLLTPVVLLLLALRHNARRVGTRHSLASYEAP